MATVWLWGWLIMGCLGAWCDEAHLSDLDGAHRTRPQCEAVLPTIRKLYGVPARCVYRKYEAVGLNAR